MLSKVEEKTYEYGMLRALGLEKIQLIQVIVSQAFYFAIPALIVGLLLSFFAGVGVSYYFQWLAILPPPNWMLNTWAIVIPIIVGLSIPLIANIVPIRVWSIHKLKLTLL